MKRKIEMEYGKKYKGYGMLNEYGEFEFIPEETGSRKDKVKIVQTGRTYTVSHTKRHIIVHFKLTKAKLPAILQEFTSLFNVTWNILRTYEF